MTWIAYESPLGPLTLIGSTAGLRNVHFPGRAAGLAVSDRDPAALAEAATQLDQYFAGQRQAFELKLDLEGTRFQTRVWSALQRLPYGQTTTYGNSPASLRSSPRATSREPARSRGRSEPRRRRSLCLATA